MCRCKDHAGNGTFQSICRPLGIGCVHGGNCWRHCCICLLQQEKIPRIWISNRSVFVDMPVCCGAHCRPANLYTAFCYPSGDTLLCWRIRQRSWRKQYTSVAMLIHKTKAAGRKTKWYASDTPSIRSIFANCIQPDRWLAARSRMQNLRGLFLQFVPGAIFLD